MISLKSIKADFDLFKRDHSLIISILIDADQKMEYDNLFPEEGITQYFKDNFLSLNLYANAGDICFFGGWPSLKTGGLCRRPWGFDLSDRFGISYDKGHYCGGADQFRCNPILFGSGNVENSYDRNNGGIEKGICVNFKTNSHSIRDVTTLCSKASANNLESLYRKYKSDENYRNQFNKMKEEVMLFCEDNPHYNACSELLGRVNLLETNFACLEGINEVMPVSGTIMATMENMAVIGQNDGNSLAPLHSIKPVARPSRKVGSTSQSCEELFSGKDVLYIGDSHSYLTSQKGSRMGNKIAQRVEQCGAATFHYRGVCGSRPSNWMPGKVPRSTCGVSSMGPGQFQTQSKGQSENLAQLSEKTGAQVVMINLGDNMFNWRSGGSRKEAYISSEKRVEDEVKGLLKVLEDQQQCVWIGPAYHSPGKSYAKSDAAVDQMYSALQKAIGSRCRIIDSRKYFSSSTPNDGLHFISSESERWGDAIAKDL